MWCRLCTYTWPHEKKKSVNAQFCGDDTRSVGTEYSECANERGWDWAVGLSCEVTKSTCAGGRVALSFVWVLVRVLEGFISSWKVLPMIRERETFRGRPQDIWENWVIGEKEEVLLRFGLSSTWPLRFLGLKMSPFRLAKTEPFENDVDTAPTLSNHVSFSVKL